MVIAATAIAEVASSFFKIVLPGWSLPGVVPPAVF